MYEDLLVLLQLGGGGVGGADRGQEAPALGHVEPLDAAELEACEKRSCFAIKARVTLLGRIYMDRII